MTTFPALIPSSRTFTPGEYPATAFAGYSGVQNRVRHSNVILAAQLRLTFLGLNEAQMLDIWNHYNGRRGEFRSFTLPAEVVSYGSITDYVPGTYQWIYAGPGQVDDLPCGGHNVTLTLETVPPSAASMVGAQLFIGMRLAAGSANGGEYQLGVSQSIALSIDSGSAFIAQNGIAAILILALQPGGASGDVTTVGLAPSINLTLNVGAAVNAGAAGVNEVITLSLTAGAADGGAPVDPNFSSVTLLLHMDGSNGSTTFTDSSSNGLTVTTVGNAKITTSDSVFGGACLDLRNTGRLTIASNALFAYNDFTVEMWAKRTGSTGSFGTLLEMDTREILIRPNTGTNGDVRVDDGALSLSTAYAMPLNQWVHLALTRSGSTCRFFVDGVQIGTRTDGDKLTNATIWIGDSTHAPGRYFIGLVDELRMSSIARYNANFTPPTAPFPDS